MIVCSIIFASSGVVRTMYLIPSAFVETISKENNTFLPSILSSNVFWLPILCKTENNCCVVYAVLSVKAGGVSSRNFVFCSNSVFIFQKVRNKNNKIVNANSKNITGKRNELYCCQEITE